MSVGAGEVTALVPAWGSYAGAQLDEALASVIAQDFGARIVVIDNASEPAIRGRDGVEVVRTPARLTLGAARNFGLAQVSTPFVLVWDADDVMLPGTLAALAGRLREAGDHVAFAAGIIDESTGDRYRWPRRWTTGLVRFPRLFAFLQCVWSAYPTTGATLMRTESVRAAGGYSDEVSGSDWGLGAALAFRGRLGWDERPGRVYRRRPGSVWAQNSGLRRVLAHCRSVRRRLRADSGVPMWARAMLPLVALAQYVGLFVVRPPLLVARRIGRRFRRVTAATTAMALVVLATGTLAAEPRTGHRVDGVRTWSLVKMQLSYGQRPAGSPQLQALARKLRPLLPHGKFEPLPGQPGLRNIVGTLPGSRPGIVIGAHYDTLADPPGFVGANNGAAGTAIVVEAARALSRMKLPRGREIRFVLFDGEEPPSGLPEQSSDFYNSGLRGSRAYMRAHPNRTTEMVLLDYVGNTGLTLPREGTSDRALWSQLRRAARAVGAGRYFPSGVGKYYLDDHTPFLRAGVPAIDLIDPNYNGHDISDRLDKLSRASIDAVGETIVELARRLR